MNDDYYDVGTYSRPVSTNSAAAQVWFDRGLTWYYAFNHEEAVRCFRRAAEQDPDCAMAYWGIASALGSEYNKRWADFTEEELKRVVPEAKTATDAATARLANASPVEQGLIRALERRFQSHEVPRQEELNRWNDDYTSAMRQIYAAFPALIRERQLTCSSRRCGRWMSAEHRRMPG
jgi:tetratricopeptide (TPR) repeat protein